jgi:hypothetical protein
VAIVMPILTTSAMARQKHERPRKPLLAGTHELVNQVLFDLNTTGKQLRDESLGQRMLNVQESHHGVLGGVQPRVERRIHATAHLGSCWCR